VALGHHRDHGRTDQVGQKFKAEQVRLHGRSVRVSAHDPRGMSRPGGGVARLVRLEAEANGRNAADDIAMPDPERIPRADEGRTKWVRQQARMPAEEWVARHGHLLMNWSHDEYTYGDPALDAWVRAVPLVYADKVLVERLRDQFLTPAERAAIADDDGT
jgi:hypothetical protein